MINQMRKLHLEQRAQRQEKHSPAFNLLASRLTTNPDMGVGQTPIDIPDLCAKLKDKERDAFISFIGERKKTLEALKDNSEIVLNLRKSYETTLKAISQMYKCLGVEEKEEAEESTQ